MKVGRRIHKIFPPSRLLAFLSSWPNSGYFAGISTCSLLLGPRGELVNPVCPARASLGVPTLHRGALGAGRGLLLPLLKTAESCTVRLASLGRSSSAYIIAASCYRFLLLEGSLLHCCSQPSLLPANPGKKLIRPPGVWCQTRLPAGSPILTALRADEACIQLGDRTVPRRRQEARTIPGRLRGPWAVLGCGRAALLYGPARHPDFCTLLGLATPQNQGPRSVNFLIPAQRCWCAEIRATSGPETTVIVVRRCWHSARAIGWRSSRPPRERAVSAPGMLQHRLHKLDQCRPVLSEWVGLPVAV